MGQHSAAEVDDLLKSPPMACWVCSRVSAARSKAVWRPVEVKRLGEIRRHEAQ